MLALQYTCVPVPCLHRPVGVRTSKSGEWQELTAEPIDKRIAQIYRSIQSDFIGTKSGTRNLTVVFRSWLELGYSPLKCNQWENARGTNVRRRISKQ